MIKRIVKMSFEPQKIDTFKAIFKANSQHIKSFPGCSHVELLQDQNNPSVFFTYSLWENEECVENYRQSELFATVWAATKILFNDKPQAWTVKEINF
ncbi:MAG: antibiotic biosynthesis monooxygenase [Bacteroidetes bacterium]|nr:antibiotic biosynthesis monooxygenase [Bacteroidota bacterium]